MTVPAPQTMLKKAIYGLKQASKAWYDKCKNTLKDLGFKSLPTEPCIYVKGSNTSLCVLVVYVDDILVFYRDDQIMTEFVKELEKCFDIRDLHETARRFRETGDEKF
jgi:histone deacetylase 1/2